MPRLTKQLSAIEVSRLTYSVDPEGRAAKLRHAVGGVAGLCLVCYPPTQPDLTPSRTWVLRKQIKDKRRELGLGAYPEVTLASAREKARELSELIRSGHDPILERQNRAISLSKAQAMQVTFKEVAAEYIELKKASYKRPQQTQKLIQQLTDFAYPVLADMVLADIDREHIEAMLNPIWYTKTESASRALLHVKAILDLATVKKLRQGQNPAIWTGNLSLSFPKKSDIAKVKNQPALAYKDLPRFMHQLSQVETIAARALEFVILSAARVGEVRLAKWSEFDLEACLWLVPATNVKTNTARKVPLSKPMLELLAALPRHGELVFTTGLSSPPKPITDAAIGKVRSKLVHGITTHGFRTTFKTWAQEQTNNRFADEVSELQLGHISNDASRAAYARGELIEQRRELMTEYAIYSKGATWMS